MKTRPAYGSRICLFLTASCFSLNTSASQEAILFEAAQKGDATTIAQLLKTPGLDVNKADHLNYGHTALMLASIHGDAPLVEQFLKVPAINVEAVNYFGTNALMLASMNGNTHIVEQLLKVPGIDVNRVNYYKKSALMLAAMNGHAPVVERLVKIPGIDVYKKDYCGHSALLLAALHEHAYVVEQLSKVTSGADYLLFDALIQAAKNGEAQDVERLLKVPGIDVNKVDYLNRTALIYAAENGHANVVTQLLKVTGIDVNKEDYLGYTALLLAAMAEHASVVEQLLHVPGIGINSIYKALIQAAKSGKAQDAERLLKVPGIDVNKVDYLNHSALMYATENGHADVVAQLLKTPGIDVNKIDYRSYTALMLASMNGHANVVIQLLKAPGIDVNKVDYRHTALMYAAEKGHISVIEQLLKAHGIDSNKDILGNNALTCAAENGHASIVELLLKTPDIDVAVINSALLRAAMNGHVSVVKLLLNIPSIDASKVNKALLLAAMNGHAPVIEQLLKVPGIDVTQKDDFFTEENALMLASKNDHFSVVKLLVKHLRETRQLNQKPFVKSCCLHFTTSDHNGAEKYAVRKALFSKTIAIISPYLTHETLILLTDLFKTGHWSLFVNKTGSLFVAVPSSLDAPTFYQEYGFKNLTKIQPEAIEQLLHELQKKKHSYDKKIIDEFRAIIDETAPNHATRFVLGGHGFAHIAIADIALKDFGHLLNALSDIKAEFLYISSCHTGGINLVEIQKQIRENIAAPLNYYIVVESTTDTVTSASYLKTDILFEQLEKFFNWPQYWLYNGTEKKISINDILKNSVEESAASLATVRHPGLNAFFRPAENSGSIKIITALDVKKMKIAAPLEIIKLKQYEESLKKLEEEKPYKNKSEQAEIQQTIDDIKDAIKEIRKTAEETTDLVIPIASDIHYIQTFPSDMSNLTLAIESPIMPQFISKIPGDGYHCIGRITYTGTFSFESRIEHCIETGFRLSAAYATNANKCWFIKEFVSQYEQHKNTLNKLVIFIKAPSDYKTANPYELLYYEDGHLYHVVKGQSPQEIIDNQEAFFANKVREWAAAAQPSDGALLEATGGIENKRTIQEALEKFIAS